MSVTLNGRRASTDLSRLSDSNHRRWSTFARAAAEAMSPATLRCAPHCRVVMPPDEAGESASRTIRSRISTDCPRPLNASHDPWGSTADGHGSTIRCIYIA